MSELKDDLRDLVLGVSIDLVVTRQYLCHGKYGFKFEAHCLFFYTAAVQVPLSHS